MFLFTKYNTKIVFYDQDKMNRLFVQGKTLYGYFYSICYLFFKSLVLNKVNSLIK